MILAFAGYTLSRITDLQDNKPSQITDLQKLHAFIFALTPVHTHVISFAPFVRVCETPGPLPFGGGSPGMEWKVVVSQPAQELSWCVIGLPCCYVVRWLCDAACLPGPLISQDSIVSFGEGGLYRFQILLL